MDFFIPRIIRIGYQDRNDTYSKKLGYVIYIDNKGVVRKEKSWKGWIKHEMGDFNNVPTEGFVLNKNVGGYKSHWNYRQSKIRVYDPRGCEFELSLENMLMILDYCDCLHGKGLVGKFVWAWEGEELWLLPCESEEYKQSYDKSEKMYSDANLKTSDLIPGSSYKIKGKINPCVFVGKFKIALDGGKYQSKLYFTDCNDYERLIRVDMSSIECKMTDDVLTKEELNEIEVRFNNHPASYAFWKLDNIIDHFYASNESSNDYYSGNTFGYNESYFGIEKDGKNETLINHNVIINNDGTASLIKAFYIFNKNLNKNEYHSYIFGSLNTDLKLSIVKWLGPENRKYYYGYNENFDNKYCSAETLKNGEIHKCKNLNDFADDIIGLGILKYVTKEGYESSSLYYLIRANMEELIGTYTMKIPSDYSKSIKLPTKINI